MRKTILAPCLLLLSLTALAQPDLDSQIPQDKKYTADVVDDVYGITLYEKLNLALEGDSVRMKNGYAVEGWVEDFYEDGQMLHRGYYIEGQLKVYKNYYPNGNLEREFVNVDGFRAKSKLYYNTGATKSEVKYVEGTALLWIDFYKNGNMEYYEEYNKNFLYHEAKKSFFEDGTTESLFLRAKKLNFTQEDFYQDGKPKVKGFLSFDENMYDYYRTGKWTYFKTDGSPEKEESYSDGKVVKTKDL